MKILLKIGSIYLARTFADVVVKQKVVRFYEQDPFGIDYVETCLVDKNDVKLLKNAGIPYEGNEDPQACLGTLFKFQVIKKVNNYESRRSSNVKKVKKQSSQKKNGSKPRKRRNYNKNNKK